MLDIALKIQIRRLTLLLYFEMSELEQLKKLRPNDELDKLISIQNVKVRTLREQLDRTTKKAAGI